MQKLISELTRLYLLEGQQYHEPGGEGDGAARDLTAAILAQHLRGERTVAIDLVTPQGLVRTLVIGFDGAANGNGERHWGLLCEVANALQGQLNLPAPAVSISGHGYALWLSLATPVPAAQARQFLQLLRAAYLPDVARDEIVLRPGTDQAGGAVAALLELPLSLHQASSKWAAFINPGMGASFSEEPGLDMAPPFAAQAAFLEGLQSISAAQFAYAFDLLVQRHGAAPQVVATVAAPSQSAAAPGGLLLQDATLDDIVRFLHAKNIEPTFRCLIKQ